MNVGIATVVEFLQKKGHTVEANPNTKITEEQYAILVKEFSTDKNLRLESERFIQERQNKDRNKASVSIDGFRKQQPEKPKSDDVIKTVVPEDSRPKFKPVGKIDLNNLSGRKTEKTENQPEPKAEAVAERPVAEPEVKKEEVATPVQPQPAVQQAEQPARQPEPVQQREQVKQPEPAVEVQKPAVEQKPVAEPKPMAEPKPEVVEKVVEKVIKEELKVEAAPAKAEERKEEKPVAATPVAAAPEEKEAPKGEEVFKIRQTELGAKINVIGQIDLAALNQSTRPKKKSKEEKRREREEKEKIRQDQKKLMKEAIIKEIRKDDPNRPPRPAGKDGGDAANKKKRNRINKEKVDVNNVATSGFAAPRPNVQGKGGNNGGGNGNHGGNGGNGGNAQGNNNRRNNNNNNRDRFKKRHQAGGKRRRRSKAGERNTGTSHYQRQEQDFKIP